MGAKRLGGKRPGGKHLGGETTRGGNGLGAKRPGFVYKSDNKHRLCFMNFHHTEYKIIKIFYLTRMAAPKAQMGERRKVAGLILTQGDMLCS